MKKNNKKTPLECSQTSHNHKVLVLEPNISTCICLASCLGQDRFVMVSKTGLCHGYFFICYYLCKIKMSWATLFCCMIWVNVVLTYMIQAVILMYMIQACYFGWGWEWLCIWTTLPFLWKMRITLTFQNVSGKGTWSILRNSVTKTCKGGWSKAVSGQRYHCHSSTEQFIFPHNPTPEKSVKEAELVS